jgi:hypothetical protein
VVCIFEFKLLHVVRTDPAELFGTIHKSVGNGLTSAGFVTSRVAQVRHRGNAQTLAWRLGFLISREVLSVKELFKKRSIRAFPDLPHNMHQISEASYYAGIIESA